MRPYKLQFLCLWGISAGIDLYRNPSVSLMSVDNVKNFPVSAKIAVLSSWLSSASGLRRKYMIAGCGIVFNYRDKCWDLPKLPKFIEPVPTPN